LRPAAREDGHLLGRMGHMENQEETYNPWSIVNLVFRHLASEGLHPVLGETGDPGEPAAALLRALGITPTAEGNRQVSTRAKDELARLREAFEAEHPGRDRPPVSG
jgi:hypothetical protein